MKREFRLSIPATALAALLSISAMPAGASVSSFSLKAYPGITQWNALGLAADPANGDVFVDSLSYGGEDNFYKFTPSGTLLSSTRTHYFGSGEYSPTAMTAVDGNNLYVNLVTSDASGRASSWIAHVDGSGNLVSIAALGAYVQGLGYLPASNDLFAFDYSSPGSPQMEEMTLDGKLVRSTRIDDPYAAHTDGFVSAAFDPSTGSLFFAYAKDVIVEYRPGTDGALHATRSFDLKAFGVSNLMALDLDRATDDFYIQDNNDRVLRFGLEDLLGAPPIPEPGSAILFLAGLGWLASKTGTRSRQRWRIPDTQ